MFYVQKPNFVLLKWLRPEIRSSKRKLFRSYSFCYKESLYEDPTCRRPKILGTFTFSNKIPKELFNFG